MSLKIFLKIQKLQSPKRKGFSLKSHAQAFPLGLSFRFDVIKRFSSYNPLKYSYFLQFILFLSHFIGKDQWRSQYGVRGQSASPWQRKNCQKWGKRGEKSGKSQEKEEKSGRKGKNREGSFTLPLLTDRTWLRYWERYMCVSYVCSGNLILFISNV